MGTITITLTDQGLDVKREGFQAVELIGILEICKQDIIKEISAQPIQVIPEDMWKERMDGLLDKLNKPKEQEQSNDCCTIDSPNKPKGNYPSNNGNEPEIDLNDKTDKLK